MNIEQQPENDTNKPVENIRALAAAQFLARALAELERQDPDIQAAIRAHVERHYPESIRRIHYINYDHDKALCILTRITHETEAKQNRLAAQQREREIASKKQSEISNLQSQIPSQPTPPQPHSPAGPQAAPMRPSPGPQADLKRPSPGPQADLKRPSPGPQPTATRPSAGPSSVPPSDGIPSVPKATITITGDPANPAPQTMDLDQLYQLFIKQHEAKIAAQKAADPTANLNYIERELLHHLKHKSPLDNLPAEQLEELKLLVEEYSAENIANVITLPAPHGWGIKTSETSIKRFKRRHRELRELEEQKALLQSIDDPIAFESQATRLLNKRLALTLKDPDAKTRDIRDLYQSHLRKTLADLAAKRLTLAELKVARGVPAAPSNARSLPNESNPS